MLGKSTQSYVFFLFIALSMTLSDLSSLHSQVLLWAFAVSCLFGVIAQKTHFCTMGAVSDIVNMGDWNRMRMWGMAVGVAMLGFHGMGWLGWIDVSQTFYTGGRVIWLSALVGGGLFGFGMVLASGCGSKTLVRIGGGSLKAVAVFFVMGVAAFATLRGVTAVLRVKTVDAYTFELSGGSGLPNILSQLTGIPAGTAGVWVPLVLGSGLILWAMSHAEFRHLDNVLAGFGIGACVAGMWWVTGHMGFVEEHPETLERMYLGTSSGVMESLTFTAPMAYTIDWLMYFSDTSKLLTVGIASVAGVLVGSMAYSVWTRSFHWEGFQGTQDTALHLAGAVLMGVGGVTAMGCTVGQGLSGLSTLSITSLIAVIGILSGAIAGLRFQLWLVMRD